MAFNLRSQSPLKQDSKTTDMYGNPIIAKLKENTSSSRSSYEPRTNIMNIGSDAASWANKDKVIAHENFHAKQFKEGKANFDIAHNTENKQWMEMQKRPGVTSSDSEFNKFNNRKSIEASIDINDVAKSIPESRFFRRAAGNLIYDKIVDRQQYDNPYSLEGEANHYENTGKAFSPMKQNKSPLQKQKLSPKAARAKAIRDLAYAKTDDRTEKKAHSQRMHRKSPGNKNMDYDHEDGRFESVKQNRGNEGEGTKKESGKNYKINKK